MALKKYKLWKKLKKKKKGEMSAFQEVSWAFHHMHLDLSDRDFPPGREGVYAFWQMGHDPVTRMQLIKMYHAFALKEEDKKKNLKSLKDEGQKIVWLIDDLLKWHEQEKQRKAK